jgi:hypothetical protein
MLITPCTMTVHGTPGPRLLYIATASATAAPVVIPATAQEGDLGIFIQRCVGAAGIPADAAPAEWGSPVASTGFTGTQSVRQSVHVKILESGDPGANLTGMDDSVERYRVYVFRPNRLLTGFTVGDVELPAGTNGSIASRTVNVAGIEGPLIVLATYGTNASSPGGTFVPAEDNGAETSGSNPAAVRTRWKLYNYNPVDTAIDMTDPGSNNIMQGMYIKPTFS